MVQVGVGPCVLVECLVSAYSLQGSHHPKIITGQPVSWAHNPVFDNPPFLWATCVIIIFTNSAKWRSARLRLLKGSHSPAVQLGGQRGRVQAARATRVYIWKQIPQSLPGDWLEDACE